jgi:hypothetical protein
MDGLRGMASPSQAREEAHRLDDDLQMLQVEQQVSNANAEKDNELRPSKSMHRSRSRRDETVDDFDVATNPLHEKAAIYKPPEQPNTNLGKVFKKIHGSSFIIRYITYITPVVLILLIPLLLGALLFKEASVGGVRLVWFSIWLEIVWLTLWAGRVSDCRLGHYLTVEISTYQIRVPLLDLHRIPTASAFELKSSIPKLTGWCFDLRVGHCSLC